MASSAFLQVEGLSRRFGPVQALCDVSLQVDPGEVHAVIGENGAGKSTLIKILSGVHEADSGTMRLGGRRFQPTSPLDARAAGLATIYQELALAPHLTVAQNMTLGIEQTRFGFLRDTEPALREALGRLGHAELDLSTPAGELTVGMQQVIEIARALVSRTQLVILDEPTSSLAAPDTEALFDVIGKLQAEGVAVIYISHFLEEVQRIADRYTVLRDGRAVASGKVSSVSLEDLVRKMVGRPLTEMFPRVERTMGKPVLRIENLSGRSKPQDVSITVRQGEVVGFAGLVGAGRSEFLRCLFGLESGAAGTFQFGNLKGDLVRQTPRKALQSGFDFLSEDRKTEGLATGCSVEFNVTLSSLYRSSRSGWVRPALQRQRASEQCRRLGVRLQSVRQAVRDLSGGNQQKVALARLLEHDSDVLLLDEPTRGIDIASKAEIAELIGRLAAAGKAVLVVSSYLPELFGICDTLAVMHRGRLSPPRPVTAWSEHEVMRYATTGRDAMPESGRATVED